MEYFELELPFQSCTFAETSTPGQHGPHDPWPFRERSARVRHSVSLLPAENATGNYVKTVQRGPVGIIIDDRPVVVAPLKTGLTVDLRRAR
jgi:hypothetical protein